MTLVLLTALGVGGATMFGAIIGFFFRKIPHKFNDAVLGFAAGVMLAASFVGLIMPAFELGNIWVVIIGVFAGAVFLDLLDRITPHQHVLSGSDMEPHQQTKLKKVMLFVLAIAIHNLPEGIAAGVGFGTNNTSTALTVAAGIALQNIPEGMVIIGPMLAAGISPGKTLLIALGTGVIEVIGTLIGYFAVTISHAILPFALAFAAGTMVYVISDEMIPETHAHGYQRMATYSLILGISVMLVMDYFIG